MLKATIERNDNVDINYPNLYTFIKENPIGIVGAKVPVFEPNHVRRFLLEAPDEEYLFAKVTFSECIFFCKCTCNSKGSKMLLFYENFSATSNQLFQLFLSSVTLCTKF